MLEEVSHSCNHWTQLSESVEQQVTGLHDRVEVLRVTALAQKQKGDASKPALAGLERSLADLQAQLAAEQKSHQLTQVLTGDAPQKPQATCGVRQGRGRKTGLVEQGPSFESSIVAFFNCTPVFWPSTSSFGMRR